MLRQGELPRSLVETATSRMRRASRQNPSSLGQVALMLYLLSLHVFLQVQMAEIRFTFLHDGNRHEKYVVASLLGHFDHRGTDG